MAPFSITKGQLFQILRFQTIVQRGTSINRRGRSKLDLVCYIPILLHKIMRAAQKGRCSGPINYWGMAVDCPIWRDLAKQRALPASEHLSNRTPRQRPT
jgi:hypothetical protein